MSNEWNEDAIRSSCRSREVAAELDKKSSLAKLRAGKDNDFYEAEHDKALAEWFVNNNLAGSDMLKTSGLAVERLSE